MRDPSEVQAEPHPGPQFENKASPIKPERKFPWIKTLLILAVLFLVYRGYKALTGSDDEAVAGTTTTKERRQVSPLGLSLSERDRDIPRLIYAMGTEVVFEYNEAYYRLPDGVGPIGGDFFCSMCTDGIAVLNDPTGDTYRVGVDRTYSADLRRSTRGTAGSILGGNGSD